MNTMIYQTLKKKDVISKYYPTILMFDTFDYSIWFEKKKKQLADITSKGDA